MFKIKTMAAFLLLLYGAYAVSPLSLLKAFLICFIPFVIVSLVRRIINAPRPYELYDFYEESPRSKKGSSFPSRHVYSASVIATLLLFVYPIVGYVMLFFALLLAAIRVLLGIHFIRDVVCGGSLGVGAALLGAFIFTPF